MVIQIGDTCLFNKKVVVVQDVDNINQLARVGVETKEGIVWESEWVLWQDLLNYSHFNFGEKMKYKDWLETAFVKTILAMAAKEEFGEMAYEQGFIAGKMNWKELDDKAYNGQTFLLRNSNFPNEIISASWDTEHQDWFAVIHTTELSFKHDTFNQYCEIN